jgi:hypothetical protein
MLDKKDNTLLFSDSLDNPLRSFEWLAPENLYPSVLLPSLLHSTSFSSSSRPEVLLGIDDSSSSQTLVRKLGIFEENEIFSETHSEFLSSSPSISMDSLFGESPSISCSLIQTFKKKKKKKKKQQKI